jgi:aspartyl-tRNA(Asn)/glutamyl-tRNA(Gln) amidotransferase subunit B
MSNYTDELVDFDTALDRYDPVLGFEVHVELNTKTKMFSDAPNAFGDEPNTNVTPVDLGLPGVLPVVNKTAVEYSILIGLALNCQIAEKCGFARKNYFYPDMPKNFQTSQYDEPIAFDGYLDVEIPTASGEGTEIFRVEIERAHMEEDTGKSMHVGGATGRIQGAEYSLVDFNRAGIPLIEIVTRPIVGAGERAPEVAKAFVGALRDLLRSLEVSDLKMEQGSMRCDVNLSLRAKAGDGPTSPEQLAVPLGTRSETKNVNSLRSVERAVRYEVCRHAAVLTSGGSVLQETRHWHEDTGVTTSGREKSDADDYRYFPEPDLVPVAPSREWVEELRAALPEPPAQRRKRLLGEWGFSDLEMRDVINAGAIELIEATVAAGAKAQSARKWWLAEPSRRANTEGVDLTTYAEQVGITPQHVAELESMIVAGRLNDKLARQVLEGVLDGEGTPTVVADARGLELVQDDGALEAAVDTVIAANPDVADKIRGGKVQAAGALIGQVMKEMKGQADAGKARAIILTKLGVEG